MSSIPSVEAEKSSGGRTRRCSCDVIPDDSDGSLREYNSEQERGKSAEPRVVQATEILDNVQADSSLCSMGTYLVVPGQDQTFNTAPDDRKNLLYEFSHSPKKTCLHDISKSPLLHGLLSETAVDDVETVASSDITDHSKFQVLESVLQQSSSSGMREGFITSQNVASADKIDDTDTRLEVDAAAQQYASSDDSLDFATNERLFRVCEEHVAQQRIVSVEREQCVTKEHAAMSVARGPDGPSRHRAVTVSRSQTWSFRDKAKSDQFLREAGCAKTQGGKLGGSNEQLLDEVCDVGLTSKSHSSPERSKTLPHRRSQQTVGLLPYSLEEPLASGAAQSCLLRDYDKDKDWSFVPWTDDTGNQ